jgi:putative ABC transport system permease protein
MYSFLKIFFRNVLRNKTFTFLNIIGLAIGMASFILIMLWVTDELSYDKFNINADRIFRINFYSRISGRESNSPYCPAPLASTLLQDYPEVEKTVRLRNYGKVIVKYDNISYTEYDISYADSTIFDVFTIPVINGNPETALTAPNTVAISESTAKKYFGNEDPVGKVLKFDNTNDYRVTTVFRDLPEASHFHLKLIASLYSFNEYKDALWLNNNFFTYVLLKKNSDPVVFGQKMPELISRYVAPQAVKALGASWESILEKGILLRFSIQKLTDIHLDPDVYSGFGPGGDIRYVYIFILVAIFLILLACINFINLSTAKSATRLKDVGIRKLFGVQRPVLSFHFLLESVFTVIAAYILAMVFTEVSLPYFNILTEKKLSINYFDIKFLGEVAVLILVISLLAGSYPALYLSSFKPISVLKGDMVTGRRKTVFRSILVISQFAISLILLSSVMILKRQMNYIQEKNLGYDKENLLIINNCNLLDKNRLNFKSQIKGNPQIVSITQSGNLPSPSDRNQGSIWRDGIISNDPILFTHFYIDSGYLKTFGIKVVEGRGFSGQYSTDSSSVIINQTAVKKLGWKEPIGKKIGTLLTSENKSGKLIPDTYTIIGIVEDFSFSSLHMPVEALAMYLKRSDDMIICRTRKDTDIPELLSFLKSKWTENAPGQPFEYDFIDECLHRQYKGEIRLGWILGIFTGLAFFVSCLGLFGLALFTAEQKKKEIGLRRVNGSSITQIVWSLAVDFAKLILIAAVIACPVSYFLMSRWLENFAYRISIPLWIFAATTLLSFFLAIVTIIYQSYRAATANPVNTLRSE